jgi:hypothetical protein
MILTLHMLLMPVYILLISPNNLTIILHKNTEHSATVYLLNILVISVHYLFQ